MKKTFQTILFLLLGTHLFFAQKVEIEYGNIKIDTQVGGILYLNDKYLGELPANLKDYILKKQPVGSHILRLESEDEDYRIPVIVKKDSTSYVNFEKKEKIYNTLVGSFLDQRDGRKYKTITIGEQTWMAENLAYAPKKGNYWAYQKKKSDVEKYGYLYDWETAMKVCPKGWHLPAKEEFEALLDNYGGSGSKKNHELKENGTSGFNAIMAGRRDELGDFANQGKIGYWWSATPGGPAYAWFMNMFIDRTEANFYSYYLRKYGFSVRCVKD